MTRAKRAVNGFAVDLFGQLLSQLLMFLAIKFVYLPFTTKAAYGYWLTIGSVMTWMAISDLGIGMALSRMLITVQSQNNLTERSRAINTAFILFSVFAAFFIGIGCLILPFAIDKFNVPFSEQATFSTTYYLCVVAGAIAMPLSIFGGILESNQRIALNRSIDAVAAITNTLAAVVFVIYTKSIVGLGYGLLFSVLLKAIISIYYANKVIGLRIRLREYSKLLAKQLFNFGGYFQFAKITNTVASNSDNLFITSYKGAAETPAYNFTAKLSQLFGITIASKIPMALFAGISTLVDNREHEKLKHVFNNLLRLLFRMALLMAAFALFFNKAFVILWVGEDNYGGDLLNLVFVYWILFETIFRGTSSIIYALREMRGWAIACLLEAITNIALSIILVQHLGLFGVAIATAVSRTFTTGVYLAYVFIKKDILTTSVIPLIKEVLMRSLPCIIFFLVIKMALNICNAEFNWLLLMLIGLSGALINLFSFEGKLLLVNRRKPIREIMQLLLNANIK